MKKGVLRNFAKFTEIEVSQLTSVTPFITWPNGVLDISAPTNVEKKSDGLLTKIITFIKPKGRK